MQERQPTSPLFTQVDISAGSITGPHTHELSHDSEQIRLLRELVASQDRQNELLEELASQVGAAVTSSAPPAGSARKS